ncbi:class I glutamine amidotransferase-like protein [Mycena epipterygia]|nr:class I glutamine amidotransferase-like protein [Mycena epipterygia]
MPSILFVLTSAARTLTGAHTGWYLPEAAHPYYILAPHATIDFASPAGANPPIDPTSVKLASEFFQAGKVTSAVCHGPGALVEVTDAEGKSIFAGRSATGFTNAEEIQIDKVKAKVVVDGHLITGQNPNSAKFVGEEILKALK